MTRRVPKGVPPPGVSPATNEPLSELTFQVSGIELEAPSGARSVRTGEVPDVIVAREFPRGLLEPSVAILAVDASAVLATRADAACTSGELRRQALPLLRRAWRARRLARPLPEDLDAEWVAALQEHIGADEVALVRRYAPFGSLTLEALEQAADGLDADRFFLLAPAARVADVFGLAHTDALLGVSIADREPTWVVARVNQGGENWLPQAFPLVRAAADARDRVLLADRLAEARTTKKHDDENIRKLLSVTTHDLRNVFFPIQLALKVLERHVSPTTRAFGTLSRSVATGSDLVRGLADATWVFGGEPPRRSPAVSSNLAEAWAKVLKRLRERHPSLALQTNDVPSTEVPFAEGVVESVLHTLVSNAVSHGTQASATSRVLEDGSAHILIRNVGQLPFADLARIEPFQHRARGGLGLGLFVAHHLCVAQGLVLSLGQTADGWVEAHLTIPLKPTPPAEPAPPPDTIPVE